MVTYAAYVQDTWQVTRDLTVNLGLRWEIYPFPTRGGGLGVSRFDPADGNVYIGGVGDVPHGHRRQLGQRPAPAARRARLSPNEKTVFRAGYGALLGRPSPSSTSATRTPSTTSWAHPAATFNGVDNAFSR